MCTVNSIVSWRECKALARSSLLIKTIVVFFEVAYHLQGVH